MDYKYIEQLLERYWNAETSPQEEAMLRLFFAQSELPAHLAPFKALFDYQATQSAVSLGSDFDQRICQQIGEADTEPASGPATVTARPITWSERLRPLFNAAAIVAIIATVGAAAQYSFGGGNEATWDYNTANYVETYDNPQAALDETMEAFKIIGDGLKTATAADDTMSLNAIIKTTIE